MSSAFRKINIDEFDEDVILPSDLYDPDPRGPDVVIAESKQNAQEARNLVSKWVAFRCSLVPVAEVE